VADLVMNIAKGRVAELYNRVDSNDPANSALVIVPVDVGAVTDATLRDFDTLAAILAGGVTERTTNGWTRKTLTDADLSAMAPDDANDRMDIDIPDQTWTSVSGGSGNAITDLIICYDSDTTGGTDANLVPLVILDFAITPDGSNVLATINSAGFFRAA
jgi:hypothetical protein